MSSTQWSRTFAGFLALAATLPLATGCSDSGHAERSDPEGRITYQLPSGWEPVGGSSDTRFRPTANPSVSMQVNTVALGSAGVQRRRDAWLASQRASGAEILYDEDWTTGPLPGVAFGHTAQGMRGEMHWHRVLLEGDDFVVSTELQTPPDESATWLPVYREVVASIEPAAP